MLSWKEVETILRGAIDTFQENKGVAGSGSADFET